MNVQKCAMKAVALTVELLWLNLAVAELPKEKYSAGKRKQKMNFIVTRFVKKKEIVESIYVILNAASLKI